MKEYDGFEHEDLLEAAALKYDADKDRAPRIIALGKGYTARNIVKAARENSVQVIKDNKVSSVLHKLSVGSEIPEQLYKAVAEILSFVCTIDSERKHKLGAR